jgi:hypothetical protein
MRANEESEARIRADENGRAALMTLSKDIKGATAPLLGTTFSYEFGNGIDEDGDGRTDEEEPNGRDEDEDWADLHALIYTPPPPQTSGTLYERPLWVKRPDLGDAGIDEDCRFQSDVLRLRLIPADTSQYFFEDLIYGIAPFDGRNNVLVRVSSRLLADGSITTRSAPLSYDVLSFNCLYWNPNAMPQQQTWLDRWDSRKPPGPGPITTFATPASLLVTVTIYADTTPFENYHPGRVVKTMTHRSIINIEAVVQDARYPRNPSGIP